MFNLQFWFDEVSDEQSVPGYYSNGDDVLREHVDWGAGFYGDNILGEHVGYSTGFQLTECAMPHDFTSEADSLGASATSCGSWQNVLATTKRMVGVDDEEAEVNEDEENKADELN